MAQSCIMSVAAPPFAPTNGKRHADAGFSSTHSYSSTLALSAAAPPLNKSLRSTRRSLSVTMRLASKQAYVCRDCGYIYNDRTPFDKLPDNYFCPVCGAPKRRFRAYEPAVAKNANDTTVRKARKAQIQRDEVIGQFLPVGIVVGIVALAGLYFYLNSTF